MNKDKLLQEINKAYFFTETLKKMVDSHESIIILGNGGSSSIASHITQDYTKVLKKKAFTFTDPSRLTCYINDYGQSNAYTQFLKEFCDKDTFVILISSSGNSDNILNAAEYARKHASSCLLLSGFLQNNKLNSMTTDGNTEKYWVDSTDYGIVECVHQILLHSILE
jgi:D-sedoheptulose 7-phosphate isomerase